MIIEMRTYQLKPGTTPTFEERFARALPVRQKFSPLAGFWRSEVGPLNRVIHVWPYDGLDQRLQVRADAIKSGGWPPNNAEFVVEQLSEIFLPAPFSPPLVSRQLGKIYEIRQYTYASGTIPRVIEAWSEKIEARAKLSPFVAAWYSELGRLNRWVHIWAYESADERARIRAEAIRSGVWPPASPPGSLLAQENMLVIPAAFSPLC